MQAESGQIEVRRKGCLVEARQYTSDLLDVPDSDTTSVVTSEQPLQPPMAETTDHDATLR